MPPSRLSGKLISQRDGVVIGPQHQPPLQGACPAFAEQERGFVGAIDHAPALARILVERRVDRGGLGADDLRIAAEYRAVPRPDFHVRRIDDDVARKPDSILELARLPARAAPERFDLDASVGRSHDDGIAAALRSNREARRRCHPNQ
jgi:hypothetical protein